LRLAQKATPSPHYVIAEEIGEDLQTALDQFDTIADDLKK
jgi:hypothetical protein